MKIAYFSTHEVLEYDEMCLFTEMDSTPTVDAGLDIEIFSVGGAYNNPLQAGGFMRSVIPKGRFYPNLYTTSLKGDKEHVHPDIVDWCDVVIMMHNPRLPQHSSDQQWLVNNWSLFKEKKKKVIWRSIGQSTPSAEKVLSKYTAEGLKIVRYSPYESQIPGYAGADAVIRFGKDKDEFNNWTGERKLVITTAQSFMQRGEHLGYHIFERTTQGFDRLVFGTENDNLGTINGGRVSYEELKKQMRQARVFWYFGTMPAPYTLGLIEAMMTGIPVVAVGPVLRGKGPYDWNHYEIPDIITNGLNGFVSDNINDTRGFIQLLLDDHDRAKAVGAQGRKRAIELFDELSIMRSWRDFLKRL